MVKHVFSVDWQGELSERQSESSVLPKGRMTFGTGEAPWLQPFSGVARELVLIASTVRQVDRFIRRSLGSADLSWGRSLELVVPVASVEQWERVRAELELLLNWLTDDSWKIQFTRSDAAPAVQQRLFDERPVPKAEAIALFSGGLDSVAGADVWLGKGTPTYLFSVSGDNVHAKYARQAAEHVESLHRGNTSLLAATHRLQKGKASENSPRTRGFFFFALAAAAAHALGIRRLITFEAGVGAINLPMNAAQTGAENTRAMHPRTLLLTQSVVNRLFDSEFSVEAPFLFMTKGQLCGSTPNDIKKLAAIAYSCDRPQGRRRDACRHCGKCTSCLFRRAALFVALGEHDPTDYMLGLSEIDDPYELNAFRDQALRFSEWRTISDALAYSPHLRWALNYARQLKAHPRNVDQALIELLNQHGAEVAAMFNGQARSNPLRKRNSREARHALS